jgi:tetratricopeptide (TPR) repeat protein
VRSGKLPAAEQTLARALAHSSDKVSLRLAYARLLLEARETTAAAAQYREVLRADSANADALYALALIAIQQQKLDEAHRHLLTLFEAGERRDEAAWFLAQIEEQRGHYREAHEWYGAVTGGMRAVDAAVRRGYTLYKTNGMAAALAYLSELRKRNPDLAVRLYAAEAELYFEAKQPEQALGRYEAGLREHADALDLLYGRAMMRAELGDVKAAETDFRNILEKSPEDARSLNALGYLLSNYSDRYQEAFGYIDRALKLTPEDPAVMDSMGWVQYRLGNLDQALQYLQEAHKREPDPEISAHLGEVLWQLGRRDKAQDVWRTALTEDPDHRVLRETVDRLNK